LSMIDSDSLHDALPICENPPGDSTEISEFITDYLKESGLDVTWHESNEKMYNLISENGDGNGKHLIYCGHTDVVPAGDRSKWDLDRKSTRLNSSHVSIS